VFPFRPEPVPWPARSTCRGGCLRPPWCVANGLLSSKDSTKYLTIAEELVAEKLLPCVSIFPVPGAHRDAGSESRRFLAQRPGFGPGVCQGSTWMAGRPWGCSARAWGVRLSAHGRFGQASDRRRGLLVDPLQPGKNRGVIEDGEELAHIFPKGFKVGTPQTLSGLKPVPRALLLHGQQDDLVDWRQAVEIYRRLGEPKDLVFMSTAEHRILDPEWRRFALRLSIDWFRKHFTG